MSLSPTEIARRVIRNGPVMRAAMEAVAALMRAGLLDPANELAAGALAHEAIARAQSGAETYSLIDPSKAAAAVVATLQAHHLLTEPAKPEQLAITLTEEPAA